MKISKKIFFRLYISPKLIELKMKCDKAISEAVKMIKWLVILTMDFRSKFHYSGIATILSN